MRTAAPAELRQATNAGYPAYKRRRWTGHWDAQPNYKETPLPYLRKSERK
jgi:hypothetical protein